MLAFAISPSTAADIKNNISNTEQHVSDDMAQIRLHETDTLNSKLILNEWVKMITFFYRCIRFAYGRYCRST